MIYDDLHEEKHGKSMDHMIQNLGFSHLNSAASPHGHLRNSQSHQRRRTLDMLLVWGSASDSLGTLGSQQAVSAVDVGPVSPKMCDIRFAAADRSLCCKKRGTFVNRNT